MPPLTFTLRPTHDRLLRGDASMPLGLYQLHAATAEQLTRLHYKPGVLKAVKARLKELRDAGFVVADSVPTKQFKSPYYYGLSEQGGRYLREVVGIDVPKSWRSMRRDDRYGLFVPHTLELNDVIIAAAQLQQVSPRYRLHSFLHDKDLKRLLERGLIPDAFLDFRAVINGRERRMPVLLEHDRGTEQQMHVRRKIRRYIDGMNDGSLLKAFGTTTVTVLFTTFASVHRWQQLRQWAQEELTRTHEPQGLGNRIRFTFLAQPIDPRRLWFDPCWYAPSGSDGQSLLRSYAGHHS